MIVLDISFSLLPEFNWTILLFFSILSPLLIRSATGEKETFREFAGEQLKTHDISEAKQLQVFYAVVCSINQSILIYTAQVIHQMLDKERFSHWFLCIHYVIMCRIVLSQSVISVGVNPNHQVFISENCSVRHRVSQISTDFPKQFFTAESGKC